jgi:hypothetical protein
MATSLIAAVGEERSSTKTSDRYSYLLLLRFTIVNVVGFMLLGFVWMQGWLAPLLEADSLTHMCKLIFIVFLIGLVRAAREAQRLSFELNQLALWPAAANSRVSSYMNSTRAQDSSARATLSRMLQLRLAQKIAPVRHIASRLVLLGIIGTIVGFIIALYGGIDKDAATDVTAVGPMVALVLQGIGVAFFKTLTGSVLNVWLMVNYRLLEEGSVHLVTHVTELAEKRGALA